MNNSDLKFGDLLVSRCGNEYVVFDIRDNEVALSCRCFGKDWGGQTYGSLINYDLTGKDDKEHDIMFVYRAKNSGFFSMLFETEFPYKKEYYFEKIYERKDNKSIVVSIVINEDDITEVKSILENKIKHINWCDLC